jgi:Domain of unknown function (DUF4410)
MRSHHNAVPDVPLSRNLPAILSVFCTVLCLTSLGAKAEGPLAAHIEITSLKSYSGGQPLPKPTKILVYDFEFDPKDVQVDKTQEIRPRHIIERDENPGHIGQNAAKTLSTELIKELAKTGLRVERSAAGSTPPDNSLIVNGSFTSIKQGIKTERVVVGMGTGSAEVGTHVQVQFKTPQQTILISEFETQTTLGKNLGAGVPVAAGLNPAVAASKATVSDRKKTVSAYSSHTADAAAKQITGAMAGLGWVKVDEKGKVIQ